MMPIMVKNTFLECAECGDPEKSQGPKQRSQSLPRSFCPRGKFGNVAKSGTDTDASTAYDSPHDVEFSSDQDSPESDCATRPQRPQNFNASMSLRGRCSQRGHTIRSRSACFNFPAADSSTDNEDAESFKSCDEDEDVRKSPDEDANVHKSLDEDDDVHHDIHPLLLPYPEQSKDDDGTSSGARTPVMPWASTPTASPPGTPRQPSPPDTPRVTVQRPSRPPGVFHAPAVSPMMMIGTGTGQQQWAMLAVAAASIQWPPTLSTWAPVPTTVVPETTVVTESCTSPEPQTEVLPETAVVTESCATPSEPELKAQRVLLDKAKRAAIRRLPQLPKVAKGSQRSLNALDLNLPLAAPTAQRMADIKAKAMLDKRLQKASSPTPLKSALRRRSVPDQLPEAPQKENRPPGQFHTVVFQDVPEVSVVRPARWADEVDEEDAGVPQLLTTDYGMEHSWPRVTLDLCNALTSAEPILTRTPLRALRRMPFTPCMIKGKEARDLVDDARQALLRTPQVMRAEIKEGSSELGSSTTIVAAISQSVSELESKAIYQAALADAKSALLEAAATSYCAYIIGHMEEPFTDLGEESGVRAGFVAQIGFVLPSEEATVCWDSYQKGYCERIDTCRWCHAQDTDIVTLVVHFI